MDEPDQSLHAPNPQVWETLRASHAAYMSGTSLAYDEVLTEVAERIRATASIGKADIGALSFWKRRRADTPWVRDLMTMQDLEVRAVTEKAVSAVNDVSLTVPKAASAGRGALSPLPGFETRDASALLLAAAPERMAVYDRRAQAGDVGSHALRGARQVRALHGTGGSSAVDGEAARAHLVCQRCRRRALLARRSEATALMAEPGVATR